MPYSNLVIPDAHCRPNVANTRFKALANYIKGNKIDHITILGDWWDMPSICRYDEDNIGYFERKFTADIDAGLDALTILDEATTANIKKDIILGNHEERIMRMWDTDERFSDLVNFDRPQEYFKKNNWRMTPYTKQIKIHGVTFAHNFFHASGRRSIAGEYAAANILKKKHASFVCGHSHIFSYFETPDIDANMVQGLVAGCFLEPGDFLKYAGNSQDRWWSGVVQLNHLGSGEFDFERISTKRLIKEWM